MSRRSLGVVFFCAFLRRTPAAEAPRPNPRQANHVFIKTPKCASSTSAGVARRLSTHFNLSHANDGTAEVADPAFADDKEPKVYANHIRRRELDVHSDVQNLKLPVFPLWTMLRHPADQALSAYYYFEVEHGGRSTDDEAILHWLEWESGKYAIFDYVRPEECAFESTVDGAVDCVLDSYDFVGVAELFDESMVQLAALLDAPPSAILYLASKVSAHADDADAVNHGLQGQSPTVRAFLTSESWQERNAIDFKLWETAYLRVASHAPEHKRELAIYRDMLRVVTQRCTYSTYNETPGCFCPFSSPAYWGDNGCGHACFDTVYPI